MDKDGCGSSGLWGIFPDVSPKNMVISVSYWNYVVWRIVDLLVCISICDNLGSIGCLQIHLIVLVVYLVLCGKYS